MLSLSRHWGPRVLCRMRHDITRPVAHDTDIMVVGANVIDMIAYVSVPYQTGAPTRQTLFRIPDAAVAADQSLFRRSCLPA